MSKRDETKIAETTENLSTVVEVGSLVESNVKVESLAVKTPVATAKAISPKTKIGVARYLQINPQPADITVLLKKKYAMEVHTVAEWDAIVEKLLNKKTY